MKSKFPVLVLGLLSLLVGGAIVYAERTRPRELTMPVKGMVCEGCEAHLCEKLLSTEGVRAATASHQKELTVIVEGWSQPDETALREIIKKAGYEPVDVE